MKVPGVRFVQGRNSYVDRDGMKFAIAIHNTSNDASDENEASFATRRTDDVSSHFYVDGDSVTQSLDTNARAGHAGSGNGNENAISVEITGVNGWSRTQWLNNVAWNELGRVLAYVCRSYGIAVRRASVSEMKSNPKVKAFYSHDDMRQAWGGTTHTDPGGNFPWDRLFSAVNAAMGDPQAPSNGGASVAYTPVPNMAAMVAGMFNMSPTVTLFTDGSGERDPAVFQNPSFLWMTEFRAEVAALRATVEGLVQMVNAAGGDLDSAALFAHMDAELEKLAMETRDAIADLGEGGAAQVRADLGGRG
jgi:N-acetyl-anhydromuramyl-L-alanine amidase AmpD